MKNTLYYGDNLQVLRQHVDDESVDLVYLDPPFNSNASYHVLFKEKSGEESPAQIKAFTDTWEWTLETERTFEQDIIYNPEVPYSTKEMVAAFRQVLGEKTDMMAYLVMMTPRLVELRRVLKPTGSLYLHCDPTASHYLKVVLDTIFGPRMFNNEIIWPRTNAHHDAKRYGRIHDVLLYYGKSSKLIWNPVYTSYSSEQIDAHYYHIENDSGRRFRLSDLSAQKPGGDVEYEWHGVYPPPGRYWPYSKSNMEQFEKDGRLYYTKNGRPFLKRYLVIE
jgi:adenine specific DNA methylase Mod